MQPASSAAVDPNPEGRFFSFRLPPIGQLLQGITLVSVIGGVFTVGIWKGQLDQRLEQIQKFTDLANDPERGVFVKLAAIEQKINALQPGSAREPLRAGMPASELSDTVEEIAALEKFVNSSPRLPSDQRELLLSEIARVRKTLRLR